MIANTFLLNTEDFALFKRYDRSRSYSDVSTADRALFDSIHRRLKQLADQAALSFRGQTTMKGFVSIKNPSGKSAKSLWCCIFPERSPNKSFAMQVALIVSKKGVEICLCLGSGYAERRDETTLRDWQQEFRRVQERLALVPADLLSQLSSNQNGRYYWRKQWRLDDRVNDFSDFESWLKYASSSSGNSAAICTYFTPEEAMKDPDALVAAFLQTSLAFAPLIDFVYSNDQSSDTILSGLSFQDLFSQLCSIETQPGKVFKPAMLSCVLDNLAAGTMVENKILFDDLLPHFMNKVKTFGMSATEQQAAYGFYYMGSEPFWQRHNIETDSPTGVRKGFATLSDAAWLHLQDRANLENARITIHLTLERIAKEVPARVLIPDTPDSRRKSMLDELRKHLISFRSSREYLECVPFKKEVYDRYRPIFSFENISKLQRHDFEEFLKFENNHHWKSIGRWGSRSAADMQRLRNALHVLLDGSRTLADRYDGAPNIVQGLGRAVLTPILHISDPELFGVWNNVSDSVLKRIGMGPTKGDTPGQSYEAINDVLLELSKQLTIDLWELDSYMQFLSKQVFKTSEEEDVPYETSPTPRPMVSETYSEPSFEEISTRLTERGVKISQRQLRQYHAALKSRKFVILAGLSGTGKTMLAQYYADAVGAKHLLVPVAPNWTSNEDLLGYYNPFKPDLQYQDTETSNFLRAAEAAHNEAGLGSVPYHLVLDEMNLARIEHYFAKLLSLMEVRSRAGYAFIDLGHHQRIRLTPNLFVIGTVNVDETTKDFSDKVFDRAQTIRLEITREDIDDYIGNVEYKKLLMDVWDAVMPVAPFAFRVIDDIKAYVAAAQSCGSSLEEAVDDQILQKVLPKVRGGEQDTKTVLKDIVELALNLNLPLTAKKAQKMLKNAENHGFPDFFS